MFSRLNGRWIGIAIGLLVGVIAARILLGEVLSAVLTGAIGGGVGGALGGVLGEAAERFIRDRRGLPPLPGDPPVLPERAQSSARELEPLGAPQRIWGRVVTNVAVAVATYLMPGILQTSPELVTVALFVPILVLYLYYVAFYWLAGGHVGHLVAGGRLRDVRTGNRPALWQAAVRATYELAIVGIGFLLMFGYGVLLVLQGMVVDEATVAVAERVAAFLAALIVAVPMGVMVLSRPADRRHAFDLLSRTVVVEKPG